MMGFLCVIAVASILSTMLNRNGKSGYPCFVTDCREKTFSISSLSMMFAVGVLFMHFQTEEIPFFSYYAECLFLHELV